MSDTITATELRGNIYRILDRVLKTGVAQEVTRRGSRLLIIPTEGRRLRLEDLPKRDGLNCTFDELVATSWEQEWNPEP